VKIKYNKAILVGRKSKLHTWLPSRVGWVKINADGVFVNKLERHELAF
jgi:hypothetical protein